MAHIHADYHHTHHYKHQQQSKKTLWLSLSLTLIFAIIEAVGGIISGSLALISDALHMFSDVVALLLSMVAIYYAAKKPTEKFTYGYLRFEIIAAFLNGLALIFISLNILYEGILRLLNPVEIDFKLMITVAIIGLIINVILTFTLMKSLHKENNLNIKSALWHFIGDLLNSVGVIIAAILIYLTDWLIIDALVSLLVGIIICFGGYKICKPAFLILMEATPEKLDYQQIYHTILSIDGVDDIHEFHLWGLTEENYNLSCHVLLKHYEDVNDYEIIRLITQKLKQQHNIEHVTIQIENPAINPHLEH